MNLEALKQQAQGLAGFNQKAKLIIFTDCESKLSAQNVAALASSVLENGSVSAPESKFHSMQVQFNPSSVRFDASAVPAPVKYLLDNFDATIPNSQDRKASISMSVDLIFDAVNNKDAFHSDKFRLSTSDLAADVITGIKELNGGYSVQKQTNGLIAALTRESTSAVSFVWAKMKFTGILSEVQARYTMFSVSGKPIRSVVSLRLDQIMEKGENLVWDKAFSDFFGKQGEASDLIKGKSALQDIQKYINIGI